ncbi:LacI family DNA-binding transcriptional regulator [Amphibacillus sp. Q70]|uniref:LacI family DNA-binding transcriptional regulator n=1 Tax=Amphibacillus sp. Q70 TaxID=3453416 RepID=UPI003F86A1AB
MDNTKATMKDVAEMAGVSLSTVSRVLNSPNSVRTDKRKKVQQAIKDLKYYPNALARGLIYKRTHSIGVLIPDVSNLFSAEMIRGMEDAAHELGNSLIICNTDRSRERMYQYLKVLKEKQVDGIVFTSDPVNKDLYDMFDQLRLPVVLASTESLDYNLPSVKINDEQASYEGTMYLLNKGHSNIGFISGPSTDSVAGIPRLIGFRQAIKEKLDINYSDRQIEFGTFQFEDGYEAMKRLYIKNPELTAVFAASDEMALGAISYLNEKNISVPLDVSVLGFDNTKIAMMSIPKLTTVSQPMFNIGAVAVRKLEEILSKGELKEKRIYLNHKIIERDSVKEMKK